MWMREERVCNRLLLIIALMIVGLPMSDVPAAGQGLGLADVLPDLLLREIVLNSPTSGLSHVAHFSPLEDGELNNPVVGIVEAFNSQIATQFATFPLGSSSGGMTYVFDGALGTLRRGSRSFGPSFAERALTIGPRKLNAGFNYQRTTYRQFEGQNLTDGSVKFYLRHQDCCGVVITPPTFVFSATPNGTLLNPPFEGDLVEAALSLDATTNTTAFFANYGVSDRWDIGIALPVVRVDLNASVTARVVRLVTGTLPPGFVPDPEMLRAALNTHTFEIDNPNATRTVVHNASATGLGDVVLRTKYQFVRAMGGGLAAAVDLRLPSGDPHNLLGTGGTQVKALFVASDDRGRVGHHANVGYTAASGSVAGMIAGLTSASIPDELNYSGGVEFVASPRLTLLGDFVGRTLRGAGRLKVTTKAFEYDYPLAAFTTTPDATISCGGIVGNVCRTAMFDEFDPRPGNLNLLLGTVGMKFNPFGNWLISGSVLFPLTDAGLRSRVTTVIGLDYAF